MTNAHEMTSENIVETATRLVAKYGWKLAEYNCFKFGDCYSRKSPERKFWKAVRESIRDAMPLDVLTSTQAY